MIRWVCLVVLAAMCVTQGTAQVDPDGLPGAGFLIRDSADYYCLKNALADPVFAQQVATSFDSGGVRELRFSRFYEAVNGDRVYLGHLIFGGAFTVGQRLFLVYHHQQTPDEPQMPPDLLAYRLHPVETACAESLLIPDQVSYDFLVYALENLDADLTTPLSSTNLASLQVRHVGAGPQVSLELTVAYQGILESQGTEIVITGSYDDNQGFFDVVVN